MTLSTAHTKALQQLTNGLVSKIPAVNPDQYEVPWQAMHNVAVACARVGAFASADRVLETLEPLEMQALATACVATQALRFQDKKRAKTYVDRAETWLPKMQHAGAKAHTLAELASVRLCLGRDDISKKWLAEAAKLTQDITESLSVAATLARVHAEANRLVLAVQTLDEGPWQSLFPTVHHGAGELRALAVAYAEHGAWREALALSDRCCEESGDDIVFTEDILFALARRGRKSDLDVFLRERELDDSPALRARLLMRLHGHEKSLFEEETNKRESDDPMQVALAAGDVTLALQLIAAINASQADDRDYACSQYLDGCVECFNPVAAVQLAERKLFINPVAETFDLWNAFSSMAFFAFG